MNQFELAIVGSGPERGRHSFEFSQLSKGCCSFRRGVGLSTPTLAGPRCTSGSDSSTSAY
jgi:hypothetical protein